MRNNAEQALWLCQGKCLYIEHTRSWLFLSQLLVSISIYCTFVPENTCLFLWWFRNLPQHWCKCWSENSNPASHISLGLSTSVQACPAYNYQHPGLFAWGLSLAAGGTNPHPMTRTAAEYPNSCPWGWGWLWNTVYTGSQGSPTGSSSPLHGDLLDNAHFIGCLPFPDSLSCSPAGISFTSLIDHLHINLCFRVCFWGNSN